MPRRYARLLSYLICALLSGLLLYSPLTSSWDHLIHPIMGEHTRPALAYLQMHRKADDFIYVYCGAQPAFRYYAALYGLDTASFMVGVTARATPERYLQELEALRGKPRIWVLFSHVYTGNGTNEETLIVEYLDRTANRLDTLKLPGASLYLYDMSDKG